MKVRLAAWGNEEAKHESAVEGWKSFRELAVPPEASAYQFIGTRQAFYAGVAWGQRMIISMMNASSSPEEMTAKIAAVQQEILNFADQNTKDCKELFGARSG